MGWNLLPAQSSVVDSVANSTKEFKKHYFYPSVLRALGGQADSSFIELIDDIEFVRIIRMDSTYISKNSDNFYSLSSGLEKEGFESIGMMYEKATINELFAFEEEERIVGFIAIRKERSKGFIIEIVGSLNLTSLQGLMNMDYSNFSTFIE